MNQKLYSAIRLLLGIFILLGIAETGNTLVNHYRHSIQVITKHPIVTLHQQQSSLKLIVFYCSQLIESNQKHLS